MADFDRLGRLRDDELLAAVARLVAQDRELTAELLANLGELDERGTCIERGFSSLFAYCTRGLGFCNSSAWLRVSSARVCRKFPVALELVASGALNVSVLCSLSSHLNPGNAAELLEACSYKSTRQVEELLAARFPRPDAPDSVRRLPRRAETIASCAGSTGDVPPATQTEPGASVPGATTVAGVANGSAMLKVVAAADPSGATAPRVAARSDKPARTLEALATDRFGVHFTADTAFRDLLEEVRALASYQQPGDLLSLMRAGLEAYKRELERARFKVGKRARAAKRSVRVRSASAEATGPGAVRGNRYVPAAVAREVYERDGGACTFVSPSGQRCSECAFLELDHIVPVAKGGEATMENLRLRCRAHNQLHAHECFGRAQVRVAIGRARERSQKQRDHQGRLGGDG